MDTNEGHRFTRLEDPENQIRLLRPLGGRAAVGEVLIFALSTYGRSTAPAYRAISYTWGQLGDERAILIDGKQRYVRRNCHYALWQAHLHFPNQYLWIDSVCINQADLEEKSMQVARMGETYKQAALVLSCIGPHEDDSDWLASIIAADEPGLIAKCSNSPSDYARLSEDARLWDAQKRLACREYWTRVWVLPEIVHAVEVQVLVGEARLSWATLEAIERASRPYHPYLKPAGCFGAMCEARSTTCHSISSAVGYSSPTQCADPRDRIFAHCSIIDWAGNYPDHLPLQPDYTLSTFDLAQKVAPYVFQSNLMEVLTALELSDSDDAVASSIRQREHREPFHVLERSSFHSQLRSWDFGKQRIVRLTRSREGRLTATFQKRRSPDSTFEHCDQWQWDNMLSETLARHVPQYLMSGSDVVGLACHEASEGDFLWAWPLSNDCLVLRHHQGKSYDIVGQAFLDEGVSLWSASEFSDSPQRRPEGQSLKASISLRLTAEDVVIHHLQSLPRWCYTLTAEDKSDEGHEMEEEHKFDFFKAQLARFTTRVTASTCCAATLTNIIDPVDDPAWETVV